MEFKSAQTEIARLIKRIRGLVILCGSLLCCNVLLALLLWHSFNLRETVLVPMGLSQSATISKQTISPSYLEACALFFVNERLNVTPQSVAESNALILSHVDSAYYSLFKTSLEKEQKIIQAQKISSTFYINHTQVDAQALTVIVKGQLERWVGERSLGKGVKTYQLHFKRTGNEILLTSFKEYRIKHA